MQDQSRGGIRRDLDWFKHSRKVITLRQVLLYYVVEKLVAPDELQTATYIVRRTGL
jgi:hypothetical protein